MANEVGFSQSTEAIRDRIAAAVRWGVASEFEGQELVSQLTDRIAEVVWEVQVDTFLCLLASPQED